MRATDNNLPLLLLVSSMHPSTPYKSTHLCCLRAEDSVKPKGVLLQVLAVLHRGQLQPAARLLACIECHTTAFCKVHSRLGPAWCPPPAVKCLPKNNWLLAGITAGAVSRMQSHSPVAKVTTGWPGSTSAASLLAAGRTRQNTRMLPLSSCTGSSKREHTPISQQELCSG